MGRQVEMFSDPSELDGFQTKFFEKEEAVSRFLEIFKLEPIVLINALMEGDNGLSIRSNVYPARFINRWSDIVGSTAKQAYLASNYKYNRHHGQPCIEDEKAKVRLIFMSANDDLGNPQGVVSSKNSKGIQSETHIRCNTSLYLNDNNFKTWICYFPSAGGRVYADEESLIKIEVSYPLTFIKSNKGKQKIFPCHHEERLSFEVTSVDFSPKSDAKNNYNDSDEDMDLGLKEA